MPFLTKLAAPAGLAALLLLPGCAIKQERRADPLADLYSQKPAQSAPSYKALTVAVIASVNTKEVSENIRRSNWAFAGGGGNYKDIFTAVVSVLQRQFLEVHVVERVEDAAALRPDLLAVLDSDGTFRTWDERLEVKVDVIFLAGRRQVDVVHVESLQKQFMAGTGRVTRKFAKAAQDVSAKFEAGLLASPKLAAFARGGAPAAAPALDEAPAPAMPLHSDVDKPAYRGAENPEAFALVIGIEAYESLPRAAFAERDASAMRDHLLALGYPQRNVIYLAGAKAGKAGIEKYVESWLPRNLKESSRLFVYFSGHGAPDTGTGKAYLVPYDGDAKFLENTGYPIKRLYEKLGALKAGKIVVVLDACFSGAGARSVLAQGLRPLVAKVDTGVTSERLVVFSAAAADEVTGSDETQGHGLFTYHFLKALNDKRGEATVAGLYEALLPRVQDAARRDNRDQTPQLMPPELGARAELRLR